MGNSERKRLGSFPLRLPTSMRLVANDMAQKEGLSLNQFISLAVAEKITRLEQAPWFREVAPNGSNIREDGRKN